MEYINLKNQFSTQECNKLPKEYSVDNIINFDDELMSFEDLLGYEEDDIEEYDLFTGDLKSSGVFRFNPADYSVVDGNVDIEGRLFLHSYTQCVFLITGDLNVNELFVTEGVILIVKGNTNVDSVVFALHDDGTAWFTKKLNAKNIIKYYGGDIIGVENKDIDLDDNISEFPKYKEICDSFNFNER